jgi:RNA polymerase sigma factor (sigma-70 family)
MGYSDNEIIDAIYNGNDRDVLKFMYNSLFPKVKKFILNNSGDTDAAFDIFQDTILVFYKYVKMKKFNPKYEISAFVYTVSRNLWLNCLRKEKREVTMPAFFDSSDTGSDIMEHIITREREEMISGVLSQLGKRCEQLLRYSVFYKLKNNEICEKMGFRTENAVKTRKYKCMQKLISLIESRPSLKQAIQEL